MAESFSEQLRKLIVETYPTLSQKQVAEMADVDRTVLNRFVNGTGPLNNEHIDKLFKALKLKICKDRGASGADKAK